MSRSLFPGLITMLVCFMTVPAAASPIFRLANGMNVLVQEDSRFPLVSVRLYVRAGSAWERPEEAGVSHLLEHMVFKGSQTRPEGVDSMVEKAGGYLNASTSYDVTVYLADLPAAQWKTGLLAVRDLAFDPLLRQADLDAEREVVLAEKKQRGDSPHTRLFHTIFGMALAGTPYEKPVIGTEEALRAATPDSIRDYMARRYDPRDMVLVVAGDVKADAVLAEAQNLFGAYRGERISEKAQSWTPADLTRGLQVNVQKGPWKKAYISLAFPLPGIGAARLAAADVLARLLGGDNTSLLSRKLRLEKPLVDAVSVSATSFERAGLFLITAQLDADKVQTFLADTIDLLAHLSPSDFSDTELARAKLNLEDSLLRSRETVSGIADVAGDLFFYQPSDPDGRVWLQQVQDVSKEQIAVVIRDWLRPEALSLAVLLPEDSDLTASGLKSTVTGIWPPADLPTAGKDHDKALPAPEMLDLGQGRTLILSPDRSLPYVSASLVYPGGSLLLPNSPRNVEGLAEATAAMLTSSAGGRSHAEISAFLADRASSLGASAAYLDFGISMDAPARFGDEVFGLMRDMIVSPHFRQEDLDRIKREQIAAITSREENASSLVSRHMRAFLFPGSAYGHLPRGTAQSVNGLTLTDVRDFWQKQSAQPWVLSIAGDFDREKALDFARSLPVPSLTPTRAETPQWTEEKELLLTLPGRDQAVYLMLFPTVPVRHEDSPALSLLAACLDGFGGMLFQELREKESLGYSVNPVIWSGEHAGFLAFSIVASPDNLAKAEEGFKRIARSLAEKPLPQETLDRALAVMEADYYRSRQSRAIRADEAARQTLYDRPLDFALLRLEAMKKLTPEDLQAVAARYLIPNKSYSLKVMP